MSVNSVDSLSAETLSLPGMWEAITRMSLSWHQSHISNARVISWCCWCKQWQSCCLVAGIRLRETCLWERFSRPERMSLALDSWFVGGTLSGTICRSYPAEESVWDYRLHSGCVSTTKQVLPWRSVTGQWRRRKTPGSFVGPLSDLIVSDESAVETAKWLVSRTLTNLLSLLGFAVWYFEKRANVDNRLEFWRFFLPGDIASCALSRFGNPGRLSLVLESVMISWGLL